ncbi:thermopsin precursor, partial [mine drainage metagenome]
MVNSSLNISLNYRYNCAVVLQESGLPSQALWWANVTNSSGTVSYFSRGPTIRWTAFPGPYQYAVGTSSPGFVPAQSPIRFQLNPSGYGANVSFQAAEYRLNFTAIGLGSGIAWVLNLTAPNGSVQQYTVRGSDLVLSEPAGTYLYTVGAGGYSASPDSGAVLVGPKNASATIHFQPIRGAASFGESGLPSGARWWVNLTAPNGSRFSGTSQGGWVNFSLPTGSYSFSAAAGGWAASPGSGSFTLTLRGYGRTIAFTATSPGKLSLRIRPAEAQVSVGTQSVNLSANGTAVVSLRPGSYPVEVLASG